MFLFRIKSFQFGNKLFKCIFKSFGQFILLSGFLFVSCEHKKLNEGLLGQWKVIDDKEKTEAEFGQKPAEGYSFFTNNVCYRKVGYFKSVTAKIPGLENAIGANTEETKLYFLGNKTTYQIEDDSLKIFNLADSLWESSKILRCTNDTLILQSINKKTLVLKKYKSQDGADLPFDEIVVSSSGCYGECGINNISIKSSGQAIYWGERFTNNDGLYSFTISKEQIKVMMSDFQLAQINCSKNEYEANWTDDEEITITFFKNRKILRTIRDYGGVGPTELCWAYNTARNLYQINRLQPIKDNKNAINWSWQLLFHFQFDFSMKKSEGFYLWNLLRQAKETTTVFQAKYQSTFNGENNIKKILTDGRFFKVEKSDSTQTTVDLGYNFFEVNKIKKSVNSKF